jgi:hypothetical protein
MSIALDPDRDVADQLVTASRARQVLDCRLGAVRGTLAADDVRRACLAGGPDPFGLRVANAAVTGRLDLRAARVAGPLHFVGCTFAEAPRFEGADLHELVVVNDRQGEAPLPWALGASHLPGLLANGVRIRRDLVLSGTVVTGAHRTSASLTRTSAVWLTEAQIGGRLLAVGTKVYPSGGRALQADRTRVAGDVRLVRGFEATGEVRLLAVQLSGSLDLTGCALRPRDGRALDLGEATVGGSLFLLDDTTLRRRPRVEGRIEMGRTTVRGRVLIRNADLTAPATGVGLHEFNPDEAGVRAFLVAPRLRVLGELAVERETVVRGALLLPGADIGGSVRMDGAIVWNPEDLAVDLSQATVGAVSLRSVLVEGTVNLANARLAGPLHLLDARLDRPRDRRCLIAVGARVEGDALLRDLAARGGNVDLRGAAVAGGVDAAGAVLANPGGTTLSLQQARIAGDVRLCQGFSSSGLVVLNRAVIEGRLRCDGGTFRWALDEPGAGRRDQKPNLRESAIEAISAAVRSGIGLGWRVPAGAVDLTDTHTTFLADDPETDWPDRSYLSGFRYERFAPLDMRRGHGEWDAAVRGRWLARVQPDDPRPWEQVARVLRSNGDHRGAENVLIAQRRQARRSRRAAGGSRWRVLFDWLMDVTVRYGNRPERALVALVLLVVAVTLSLVPAPLRDTMRTADQGGYVYSPDGPLGPRYNEAAPSKPCGGGEVRCFNPLLYAIDTVVPIIDLHQRSTWYPSREHGGRWMEWWLNLCTILGWTASTIFAISLTRLGRPSTLDR